MLNLSRKQWLLMVLMLLGVFLMGGGAVILWTRSQKAEPKVDGIDPAAIIREVGQLIELPKDEQPSIAIVRDVKKLQDQEIFRKAENGDILLIYVKAKRAYLYDREKGKLVDVAPVNLQGEGGVISPSPSPVSPQPSAALTPAPAPSSSE